MVISYRDPEVAQWVSSGVSPQQIREKLEAAGTLTFKALSSGLFSAVHVRDVDDDPTGYGSAWVRDNVHIANALYQVDQRPAAIDCADALVRYFVTQAPRFRSAIALGRAPESVNDRPHIRFDGERLRDLPGSWAHAQNDALGYFLWLVARMVENGDLPDSPPTMDTLALVVGYLSAIAYWQDADSGHWEEERKVCSSSIGTVVAGLRAVRACRAPALSEALGAMGIDEAKLDSLIKKGNDALMKRLPAESIDVYPRQEDSALLFLIEPLRVVEVDSPVGKAILRGVADRLTGAHGIRRYRRDSYWAPDFRQWQGGQDPSTEDEYRLARDRIAVDGQEAQWALFDPILCVIHARSSAEDAADRRNFHFQRSLAQLTGPNDSPGRLRCVEAYFLERSKWVANDHVPLLWTQANLLLALDAMSAAFEASVD
ncbi:MAG: glycoside hydrolase family 15 protein [Myxococcota bacterium]